MGLYTTRRVTGLVVLLWAVASPPAEAAERSATELARRIQNPLSAFVQLPMVVSVELGVGDPGRTGAGLQLEPVVPWAVSRDLWLISRLRFPLAYEPEASPVPGGTFGPGDVVATVVLSPNIENRFSFGVGPVLVLPTGVGELGTNAWAAGPAVVVYFESESWTAALLTSLAASFAGDGVDDVLALELETRLTRNFRDGWYLGTGPLIAADLGAPRGERWLVPVGVSVGRVLAKSEYGAEVELGVYWNPLRPDERTARWSVEASVTLFIPSGIAAGQDRE